MKEKIISILLGIFFAGIAYYLYNHTVIVNDGLYMNMDHYMFVILIMMMLIIPGLMVGIMSIAIIKNQASKHSKRLTLLSNSYSADMDNYKKLLSDANESQLDVISVAKELNNYVLSHIEYVTDRLNKASKEDKLTPEAMITLSKIQDRHKNLIKLANKLK